MIKTPLDRIDYMNALIRKKATGSPQQFASKMNISVSLLYEYLSIMKQLKAPIKYSKTRKTYYYTEAGEINFMFKSDDPL